MSRADEMEIGAEQSPEQIIVATAKEADGVAFLGARRVDSLEVGHIEPIVETVDEWGNQPAVVEDPHPLRRGKDEIGVACVQSVRGKKLTDQNREVHGQQDGTGYNGHSMAAELPPHHPPLRRHVKALLRRRHPLDGIRVERCARDVVCKLIVGVNDLRFVVDSRRVVGCEGKIAHRRLPACRRIRGSSTASARSDKNTPITVKNDMNTKNDPARYMSWLRSASSSIGPVVGKDITTETIAAPEITCGKREPISEMNGLRAIRNGYLNSTLRGGSPLARAVTTYCFCNSSSRLARNRRIMLAVPAVPMTMTGIQIWASTEKILGQVHG